MHLDPNNAGRQRDLSVSYERIGDVLRDQGNLTDALESYRNALAIVEKLARLDPNNVVWQGSLAYSCWQAGTLRGRSSGTHNRKRARWWKEHEIFS